MFVITSCDAPTVLDPVEEPLNVIAGTIEVWAEADCFLAVSFWWNVGPSASHSDKFRYRVRIVSPISQQDAVRFQTIEQMGSETAVMVLSRAKRQADRQPVAINNGMYLCRQSTA